MIRDRIYDNFTITLLYFACLMHVSAVLGRGLGDWLATFRTGNRRHTKGK